MVFCEEFKKDVYGDKIQWLIVGMYEDQWWNTQEKGVDCEPIEVDITRYYKISLLNIRPTYPTMSQTTLKEDIIKTNIFYVSTFFLLTLWFKTIFFFIENQIINPKVTINNVGLS